MNRVGLKSVNNDNTSLTNEYAKITYTKEWQKVPGNGAYVAIADSLFAGGKGSKVIFLECKEEIEVFNKPVGVKCFKWVRIIDPCPEKVDISLLVQANLLLPDSLKTIGGDVYLGNYNHPLPDRLINKT